LPVIVAGLRETNFGLMLQCKEAYFSGINAYLLDTHSHRATSVEVIVTQAGINQYKIVCFHVGSSRNSPNAATSIASTSIRPCL